MVKELIIQEFTKDVIKEKKRKNAVTVRGIISSLTLAALCCGFTNESCKSSGMVSKSQVIYRKLDGMSEEAIHECFQKNTIKFLRMLKIFSRNRRFIVSFDTTKEPFYGKQSKCKDPLYLHEGSIAKESYNYYEYITVAVTSSESVRYIIDGLIVPNGAYIEDYVYEMTKYVKEHLPLGVILFDRGFTNWGVIHKLKKLKVKYMIFWRKSGSWYKKHFQKMNDKEFKKISRTETYKVDKHKPKVKSNFILIKQLEYENKKYDWIFATNLDCKTASDYVKRYKKRWGIETIYRVTDDIRIYTTSTNYIIRYFLFMFTCLVYNIWKFFQISLGENFTLANFQINMIIFMAKIGLIYPTHYNQFENTAKEIF